MGKNQPFARRLKEARLRKADQIKRSGGSGFSQEALGAAAKIDEASAGSRINHYEQGRHAPDLMMASSLAKALDVPLAYLYCEEDWLAELLLEAHLVPSDLQPQLIELARKLAGQSS